jgi:hypothetical protein
MPDLYPRDKKEVAIPLAKAPEPGPSPLMPQPTIDQAQQSVAPQFQPQFAPDPLAVNQQQYQLQNQQMMVEVQQLQQQQQIADAPAVQPVQPQIAQGQPPVQYYYAVPVQPQPLPAQYQQPYYQQPQPAAQPQYYAVPASIPVQQPEPQAAPLLGQAMPHTFTSGERYLESETQNASGEDDFPAEYSHVKAAGSPPPTNYIKRDDVGGQQVEMQQVAPPLVGEPQQLPEQGQQIQGR